MRISKVSNNSYKKGSFLKLPKGTTVFSKFKGFDTLVISREITQPLKHYVRVVQYKQTNKRLTQIAKRMKTGTFSKSILQYNIFLLFFRYTIFFITLWHNELSLRYAQWFLWF
jgi:hypothetical protein